MSNVNVGTETNSHHSDAIDDSRSRGARVEARLAVLRATLAKSGSRVCVSRGPPEGPNTRTWAPPSGMAGAVHGSMKFGHHGLPPMVRHAEFLEARSSVARGWCPPPIVMRVEHWRLVFDTWIDALGQARVAKRLKFVRAHEEGGLAASGA